MKQPENRRSDIIFSIANNIAIITINRPDKLNAIRIQTYHDIISGLEQADNSSECKCILITGAGNIFTAGNDLSDLVGDNAKEVMLAVQKIFNTVSTLKKPLIAAVEGVAVGIGTTLLLHCDLAVASEGTKFRLPFVNLGVSPEGGSSLLLPLTIGSKTANELLLTGRFFTAEEAFNWKLVNQLTAPGKTLEAAMNYCEQIAKQPLPSILATKSILRKGQGRDISKVVAEELQVFLELIQSPETQDRISHFLKA